MLEQKKAKARRCRNCRKKAEGEGAVITPIQAFCSYDCVKEYLASAKAKKDQMKREKSILRDFREREKRMSDRHREAQTSFNAYVRIRDLGKIACISCGIPIGTGAIGGNADCSHFRSIASAPQLRYNLRNAHISCKHCNQWLSGNYAGYRKTLLSRYGQEYVDSLENDQKVAKFNAEYLTRIKKIFRKKTRIYKKLFR